MHDIWNPWHGCVKVSEGCAHCYMYYLDKVRGQADGSEIYRTANMRWRRIGTAITRSVPARCCVSA